MRLHRLSWMILVVAIACYAVAVQADVFNMPEGQTSMQFVTVGDPGNVADTAVMNPDGTTGYGSVSSICRIGKYEVTASQYCQFLNAVAKTDPYQLYHSEMALPSTSDNVGCGIVRSNSPGSYTYTVASGHENLPVNWIDWGDAARFCNWLHNGQPMSGLENANTTESGTYELNGVVDDHSLMAVTRIAGAKYYLPTENEWYKAAYYVGGGTNTGYWRYPTQSNTAPSNVCSAIGTNNANYFFAGYTDPANYLTPVGTFALSPGAYGTYDMSGNVFEWNEANVMGCRGLLGGGFGSHLGDLASVDRNGDNPVNRRADFGFRVASIPEPSTIVLAVAGGLCLLAYAWRRRRQTW